MTNNKKRQAIIELAMFEHKVTKKELATELGLSYPTMLSKLKDTGSLYLSQADNLCSYLNIDLNKLITLDNKNGK